MDYQAAKDLIFLGIRMDSLERKVELMGAQTQAALTELDSSLQEVAGELEELADQVEADDATTAGEIRTRAQRLRDLRPDENVPVDDTGATPGDATPAEGGTAVDNNDGTVTDAQGNPPV